MSARLQTVHSLLDAIATTEAARVSSLVADDVCVRCAPFGRQRGRSTLQAIVGNHLAHLERMEFRVHHAAEVDGVVLCSRTDSYVGTDCSVELDAAAVFEFDDEGLIADWTDQFDPIEIDTFPAAIAPNFATWANTQHLDGREAGGFEDANPGLARRRSAIEQALVDIGPGLDEIQRRALAAVLREMTSARTWYALTHRHGLTTQMAAQTTTRMIALQLEALASSEGEDRERV